MPFNSLKYFLFLPLVYLIFYYTERSRWIVLLAASLLFYAALNVPYLLVVLTLVTATTYFFGIWLDKAETPHLKRVMLWLGIGVNILILIILKYLPFLSENLKAIVLLFSLDTSIQPLEAFVAIGVSYYVFQAMSYLFDIYLEIEKPERHFGYFALYMAFFPKLLQGPIERVADLVPQLKARYVFNYDNMRSGMLLFTWGLFKKLVIAERLAVTVNLVYSDVHNYSGMQLLLATYAYAFQIYMDFSGYTDMALGSALLFNINLTQNFNSPYLATSVADFWRRWHISFSRWILDYIFKPLQMQCRHWKNLGTATALIVAFLVSGIWHGASWGFVIWGGMHGLYMACSVFYKPYQKKFHKSLGVEKTKLLKFWQVLVTFNLVSFTWIFFRANSLADALYVSSKIFGVIFNKELFVMPSIRAVLATMSVLGDSKTGYLVTMLSFVLLFCLIRWCDNLKYHQNKLGIGMRWALYLIAIFWIIAFGRFDSTQFIYFTF